MSGVCLRVLCVQGVKFRRVVDLVTRVVDFRQEGRKLGEIEIVQIKNGSKGDCEEIEKLKRMKEERNKETGEIGRINEEVNVSRF